VSAERRSRAWWSKTVARWKRSGLSAPAFAAREGVGERTLRWWSSALRRDTRAERGSAEPIAIELGASAPSIASASTMLEIAIGAALVRLEVGTDVAYVAALVRELGRER